MFKEKCVFITGATSGIGEALAKAFHRRGAYLILTGRNAEKLKELSALFGAQRCTTALMDMSDEKQIESATRRLLKKHPRIDILINNAGITQRSLISETKMEVYRSLMEVDFFGPVKLSSLILPSMIKNGGGHIVAISSVIGKFATPMRSGYASAKMALAGWMDALRAEEWRNGIIVTNVFPGGIKTNVSINALTGTGKKHGTMDEKQERGMDAERCASIIVKSIVQKKRELIVGVSGGALLGVILARFAPSLLARILRKAKVT